MGISPRLVAALALLALGGCVLPEKFLAKSDSASDANIQQVATTWNNSIVFAPDPTRNGEPAPGIGGRLYLFDTNGIPVVGNGSLVVDLYDDSGATSKPGGVQLEQWRIDPVTLKRLVRKDTYGVGYTIFLPWGTYRPDIKIVHLTARYEPPQGMPLFAPSGALTIDHGKSPIGPSSGPVISQP
jgi:hypothetical protein